VIPQVQDVIPPHEHYELLIVRTKGFVAIDESRDEPRGKRFVRFLVHFLRLAFSPHSFDSEEAKVIGVLYMST
jgi:hypothetical protein